MIEAICAHLVSQAPNVFTARHRLPLHQALQSSQGVGRQPGSQSQLPHSTDQMIHAQIPLPLYSFSHPNPGICYPDGLLDILAQKNKIGYSKE